jgi:hypothetical protein
MDMKQGLPICLPEQEPPMCTKVFHSDAAGFPINGIWKEQIGCGLLGLDETDNTLLIFQLWWDKRMMTEKLDRKTSRFDCKTATGEGGSRAPLLADS